jgi:hypothetical protein
MGLPEDWSVVESWSTDEPPFFKDSAYENKDISDKKIQGKTMPHHYWKTFPERALPKGPTTRVNIKQLEHLIKKHSKNWISEEKLKAAAVASLKKGAPAHQISVLPAMQQRNAPSAYEHADKFTDTLRDWVAAGVVAGPFRTPPLPQFRANCLMAVARKGKVRPVVNLSSPKGSS